MTKPKVTFMPLDGTGMLHLDFQTGSFGDAIEAKKGDGVGFFSPNGDLQGVTFDDVNEKEDRQTLEFEHYRVVVAISKGKISQSVTLLNTGKSSKSSQKGSEDAA